MDSPLRASVAQPKIEKASKKDKAYYEGQVIGARFFIEHMLPTAMAR
jgi:hypothetical protein